MTESNRNDVRELTGFIAPEVREWQFFFEEAHGKRNRLNVIKKFVEFLGNPESSVMHVPGFCALSGRIFGHSKYPDNGIIITSYLRSIEKVDGNCSRVYALNSNLKDGESLCTTICIETQNGNPYYCQLFQQNAYMLALGEDYAEGHRLMDKKGYYVPPNFRNSTLL